MSGTISNIGFGDGNKIEFRDFADMLLQLDELLDELALPKASVNSRSIAKAAAVERRRAEAEAPVIASFKLRVIFRQNASWQGSLSWINGGMEAPFRSVLELLKLMNGVLSNSAQNTNVS